MLSQLMMRLMPNRRPTSQDIAEQRRMMALNVAGQLFSHALQNGKTTTEDLLASAAQVERYVLTGETPVKTDGAVTLLRRAP